jgi:hypothetical protein
MIFHQSRSRSKAGNERNQRKPPNHQPYEQIHVLFAFTTICQTESALLSDPEALRWTLFTPEHVCNQSVASSRTIHSPARNPPRVIPGPARERPKSRSAADVLCGRRGDLRRSLDAARGGATRLSRPAGATQGWLPLTMESHFRCRATPKNTNRVGHPPRRHRLRGRASAVLVRLLSPDLSRANDPLDREARGRKLFPAATCLRKGRSARWMLEARVEEGQ